MAKFLKELMASPEDEKPSDLDEASQVA